jgi:putative transcriptional regulator
MIGSSAFARMRRNDLRIIFPTPFRRLVYKPTFYKLHTYRPTTVKPIGLLYWLVIGESGMIRLKVKEVAAEKGVSQRQLALRSGVDIKNIQKIFRYPTSIVTTETLDKLAKVLGVDAAELIESILDEMPKEDDSQVNQT